MCGGGGCVYVLFIINVTSASIMPTCVVYNYTRSSVLAREVAMYEHYVLNTYLTHSLNYSLVHTLTHRT